jgi:hypothetical protein
VVEHIDPRPVELQQADEFQAIDRPFRSLFRAFQRVTMKGMLDESDDFGPRRKDGSVPFSIKKVEAAYFMQNVDGIAGGHGAANSPLV